MRLLDYFLITVLIALGLIVTLAFGTGQARRGAIEHFDGYQVYGGSGSWPGSPQCTDKAIGFQEDTQTPGRYWGWENNQACAFYTIPQSTGPAPSQPQPQASSAGRQLGAYQQCGGKGGDCATKGQCEDKPWNGASCPQNAPVCNRVNEWHWQCEAYGAGGGAGGGPAPGPQPGPVPGPQPGPAPGPAGGVQYRGVGQVCGGRGDDCKTVTGASCVDGPWPNFACGDGGTCTRKNEWYYECQAGSGTGETQGVPHGNSYESNNNTIGKCPDNTDVVLTSAEAEDFIAQVRRDINLVKRYVNDQNPKCLAFTRATMGAFNAVNVAIEKNDYETLTYLVNKGATLDFDQKNGSGLTYLHEAAGKGNIQIFEYLLQKGADINVTTYIGYTESLKNWTVLHEAAKQGQLGMVQHLIKYKRMSPTSNVLATAQESGNSAVIDFIKNEIEKTKTT
jgi:hypothetical protein